MPLNLANREAGVPTALADTLLILMLMLVLMLILKLILILIQKLVPMYKVLTQEHGEMARGVAYCSIKITWMSVLKAFRE